MTDSVLNKLSTVDLATLVALIILVSVVIKFITPLFEKLKNRIIKKNDKENKEKSLEKIVYETRDRVSTYEDNRIHDREQSFRIQQELVDSIKELNSKLDEMNECTNRRFEENLARENKRVRAELKDRIGESYRLYSSLGKWNHMEKEALEDLIAEYEAAGGINSFVHDKVQKDMYTWELIDH